MSDDTTSFLSPETTATCTTTSDLFAGNAKESQHEECSQATGRLSSNEALGGSVLDVDMDYRCDSTTKQKHQQLKPDEDDNNREPEQAPVVNESKLDSKDLTSSELSKDDKRVTFDTIEIREYPRALGDNPSVTVGPPISIGWKHRQSYTLDVDQYENYKDGIEIPQQEGSTARLRRRRTSAEFQLPRNLREQILRDECSQDDQDAQDAGTACTAEEIKARIKEVQRAKRQRQNSYALQEFEHLEVFFESCWRKFQRLRCCGGSRGRMHTSEDDKLLHSTALEVLRDRGRSRGEAANVQ